MDRVTADSLITLTGGLTAIAELNARILALLRKKGIVGDGEIDKLISDSLARVSEVSRPHAKLLLDGVKASVQP